MIRQKVDRRLYFARDPLGRRSLLVHFPTTSEPFLALCSASSKGVNHGFEEVSTAGIFSIPLDGDSILKCTSNLECAPRGESIFAGRMVLNRETPSDYSSPILVEQLESFIAKLDESVKLRVSSIPSNTELAQGSRPKARLGILFSGGIDCTVLAFLADRHIPLEEPIDLLNVAFENPRTLEAGKKNNLQEERAQRKRNKKGKLDAVLTPLTDAKPIAVEEIRSPGTYDVPDRLAGLEEVEELRRLCPHRQWNFVCIDIPYEVCRARAHFSINLNFTGRNANAKNPR
ncbi:hypothetical protein FRC12_008711 [Ceratobasidium sp. 428]|nr:hypothetical protein FRC12_008711 [Ceratobasidium sp. 428]